MYSMANYPRGKHTRGLLFFYLQLASYVALSSPSCPLLLRTTTVVVVVAAVVLPVPLR